MLTNVVKAGVLAVSLSLAATACSVSLNGGEEGKVVQPDTQGESGDGEQPGLVEEPTSTTSADTPPSTAVEPAPVGGSSEASFFFLDVFSGNTTVSQDQGIVSGRISSRSQKDVYTFQAQKGQTLVIQHTGDCDFNDPGELPYTLTGPVDLDRSFKIDREAKDCFDGRDVKFFKSGPVTMTVSSDSAGTTGSYSFRVLYIEQPATIPIEIGTEVRPDTPREGAGRLDSPAEKDTFSFAVVKGKTYVVRGLGGCSVSDGPAFTFSLSGAASGVGSLKAFGPNCFDSKSFVAKETGEVEIVVRDINFKSTGTYSFVIEES